jgi:hypothetical protein
MAEVTVRLLNQEKENAVIRSVVAILVDVVLAAPTPVDV